MLIIPMPDFDHTTEAFQQRQSVHSPIQQARWKLKIQAEPKRTRVNRRRCRDENSLSDGCSSPKDLAVADSELQRSDGQRCVTLIRHHISASCVLTDRLAVEPGNRRRLPV